VSKQHFYARVPARLSIFNRTDSYDTFAVSEDVSREFIEKELSPLYDIKLVQSDADLIRRGEMAPIYIGYRTKSGTLVRAKVGFEQRDYSGERSAYFVHSLLLSQEEADDCAPDRATVIPSVFVEDLGGFAISDLSSRPKRDYPSLTLPKTKADPCAFLREENDPDTVRRFLYGVLAAICGKVKNVFVTLKDTSEESSLYMQKLTNAVMSVLPYHLRPFLPYATRVLSTGMYPFIKFKGIAADPMDVSAGKSAVVSFKDKKVLGLNDKDIAEKLPTVEFFYSLLNHEDTRCEYLSFCNHVVKNKPGYEGDDFDAINEMIFLFRAGSGLYEEKSVVPDEDKLLALITLYEKYREALPDDYRTRILHPLLRYSDTQTEIPKKIFAKLAKLYASEIPVTKRFLMDLSLDLLHTDLMREKLFLFIKSHFQKENKEMQTLILHHFAGIFYGGFLQTQVLSFFLEVYPKAAPEAKEEMLEKVLLAIRTKSLREQIFAFLALAMPALGEDSKEKIFYLMLEELPEGDELSTTMLEFLDAELPKAPEKVRVDIVKKLLMMLEAENRKAEHPLLHRLAKTKGCLANGAENRLLDGWSNRKICAEYVLYLVEGPIGEAVDELKRIYQMALLWKTEVRDRITDAIVAYIGGDATSYPIAELIAADQKMEAENNRLFKRLQTEAVRPKLVATLPTAFGKKPSEMPIDDIVAACAEMEEVKDTANYLALVGYQKLKAGILAESYTEIAKGLSFMPNDKIFCKNVNITLQREIASEKNGVKKALAILLESYLQSENFNFKSACDSLVSEAFASEQKAKAPTLATAKRAKVAETLLRFAFAVYTVDGNPVLREKLKSDGALRAWLSDDVTRFGSGFLGYAQDAVSSLPASADFAAFIKVELDASRPRGGFFSRLFHK